MLSFRKYSHKCSYGKFVSKRKKWIRENKMEGNSCIQKEFKVLKFSRQERTKLKSNLRFCIKAGTFYYYDLSL
jgi:hypothetical protein